MDRRKFIKTSTVVGGAAIFGNTFARSTQPFNTAIEAPWFDRSMRWAQLAFVENDPGRYDPDFWLDYFRKIHADGVLLSAGGIVAFYPTTIPLHHRSDWLGNSDPLGYLVNGCRKMNMSIILRTDPHAARQNVYEAHPDWIAVGVDGKQRRHWANKDLWVTCALGPFNFEFMTAVNKEIMERYQPEAIFSNRWSGHGICYCQHCKSNFKNFSGFDLPKTNQSGLSTAMASGDLNDPAYRQYRVWRTNRLKELWFLWDSEIRKQKSTARYIPNGFPDKLITGQHSDFFFADQQARSGIIPPWSNGKHAKELRATMGMKPQVGIFSVGIEEQYRWKDSVQSNAEIRVWVAEGVANGLRPCFVKFGGYIFDKRWMDTVQRMYQKYYDIEKYLRNTAPIVRAGVVYSEQTDQNYGGKPWQKNYDDHAYGIYHALIEDRIPFEMVNDRLLDEQHLKDYKLLILPNIAALSDDQCDQLRKFVDRGGSLLATYETSLYDEEGKPRTEFGLSDVFGVSYSHNVEGPLQNSYLRLNGDPNTKGFHPVLKDLADAYRIINGTHRVNVTAKGDFPSPVTLVPTYPDLPMEDVYPRNTDTDIRELYLRESGKARVAYFTGDLDRTFWQIQSLDHGRLLKNTIRWALNEEPMVNVRAPGVIDVTTWRQEKSMTVHLVNLTNPMMMKGPFRELIPVDAKVDIRIPENMKVTGVKLLLRGDKVDYKINNQVISVSIPRIEDHEIIGIDIG
ncbi:beta-galactosidase trimerization domain-containing protein [Chryseolinea sp. H1M3-3]|uniref:alpha-amylase family protein n=1 Tax=Chryseolinea sp. H1M3-3 TaxID=3034144 RepID=UPI0023EADC7F|nr:beta-galactosidase trimerization domain-containing protein [Chryseolinea sp. H1M3-3]